MSHFPSLVIDETVGDEVAKFSHRSLTVTATRDVILLFHGWLRGAMVGGKYPYCYGVQRRPSFAFNLFTNNFAEQPFDYNLFYKNNHRSDYRRLMTYIIELCQPLQPNVYRDLIPSPQKVFLLNNQAPFSISICASRQQKFTKWEDISLKKKKIHESDQ